MANTIRNQFELREGSNREMLVDMLLASKGKPVAVSAILKKMYGKNDENFKPALAMVLQGIRSTIAKKKIKLEVIRDQDEYLGPTITLKSK